MDRRRPPSLSTAPHHTPLSPTCNHFVGWTRRDRSTNVWPLAIASMGESWHNLHHADPTCARHGVGRGQIDMTARLIWVFEKLGWAHNVRWPTTSRLARLRSSDRNTSSGTALPTA